MRAIVIIIHGVNNIDEINNTKILIESELKKNNNDIKVKIALYSHKILNKLHKSGYIEVKGIEETFNELLEENIEKIYCGMIYVNSGESYLKSIDSINLYKDKFKEIKHAKPLLYKEEWEKKSTISKVFKNYIEEGNNILIFHGSKQEIENEIDIFTQEIGKNSKKSIILATIDDKNFIENTLKNIDKKEKTFIYPIIINRGYHYKKNIVTFLEVGKKEGYNLEFKVKTLLEYKEIREIFVKKLLHLM